MDDTSIFMDKDVIPSNSELKKRIGSSYNLWKTIYDYVFMQYPKGIAEWNFPGKKYGWSYRIKDKKRAIIYFLPRNNFFMVAFVFGDKALAEILKSDISEQIKKDLSNARKYAEGRGVKITVNDQTLISDIERLIEIKLNH